MPPGFLARIDGKAGALQGLGSTDRTAGGRGQTIPFGEGEPALATDRGNHSKAPALPGRPGQMLEVGIYLLFGDGELPGQLQGRLGFLLQQFPHGLADGLHLSIHLSQWHRAPQEERRATEALPEDLCENRFLNLRLSL